MVTEIEKRDGTIVPFEASKITNAIAKAGKATGEFDEKVARRLTIRVLDLAQQVIGDKTPAVEEIQDIVEEILLSSTYRKTAKAYILYREQHARIREITNKATVDLVDQYLNKTDWRVNENSNMAFSLQGLNNYVSSEVSKVYWLNEIYSPEIREAHIQGDFHIHDLNLLSVYCVGWDLFDLLAEGFRGVWGKVESKPARHLRSALGQIVNFFYTLQGEAAGAQAFSNFDTLLAPFIRFDGLGYKGIKQALQEFIFNINVPTRVGFQTPFTNVTLDLTVPDYYEDQCVIIGGVPQEATYGEFQKEMDLFNKAFLEVMAEGDAGGRVFTFPIPTYNIIKEFEWENPILENLWEMTAKYGVPYFSNFVNSDMNPEDARSMCCRLRIDNRELEKRGGGLFGSNPLTGSIGVVTLNMPRIGYLSNTEAQFCGRLRELMILAKESLEAKRKILERFTDRGL
jgi:ribonucleoside-triphosphate reductase